ncbi:hypothetical protein HKX48_002472 [Thoreauomyces humboldtii]|nr:hypothetical protein HKX48_002472 [Thoreauomyces humboldtii]
MTSGPGCLSPLDEDVESTTTSDHHHPAAASAANATYTFPAVSSVSSDDAAVAELMEILRVHRFPSPERNAAPSTYVRERKSSVPYLFHPTASTVHSASVNGGGSAIVAPPRLAGTPFRPDAHALLPPPPPSPASSTPSSPVSRAKNPIPFNSPFTRHVASTGSSASGDLLGLLSPSPEPRPLMFYGARPQNPAHSRILLEGPFACAGDGDRFMERPRSKSVTDLDGRIRIAFAC